MRMTGIMVTEMAIGIVVQVSGREIGFIGMEAIMRMRGHWHAIYDTGNHKGWVNAQSFLLYPQGVDEIN